jgi:molybdate transport system regulatory protein
MNRTLRAPVVEAEAGGARGGGARLTPTGADVVRRYRRVEARAAKAAAADLSTLLALLAE